jgi:hypothetical protein
MTQLLIEDGGLIYDAARQPPEARVACFTSLCPVRSGALLSGFQVGPVKQSPRSTIRLCRSDDQGKTWTLLDTQFETRINGVPGSLSSAELVEVERGRLLLFATWFDRSDPTRPLFDPITQGILRAKQLLAFSRDEGRTWSAWRELKTPGLSGCASTGPVVQWADGTLAYAFESFKEYDDSEPARHGAWLMVSRDGGESFSSPLLVARDESGQVYYWDQRLCAAERSGEFVALFWTHDLAAQRDRLVHFRRASLADSAVVGEAIRETTLPGQIAAPLELADGRLLAFVVDRRGPSTMTLWQSRDGGRTWPEQERLVIYTHDERAAVTPGGKAIDFNQYWEEMGKWSFGHPALRKLDNTRVFCAFYAGAPDSMSVHWARVRV